MNEGVVLQRRGPSLPALLRWSGLALVAGGLLLAVATALHPSRETPATILQAEVQLVAAHVLSTLSSLLILLGLPGLYGTESIRMGRLGLVGFLLSFLGTTLIAVSGNFGFIAPVLAAESPETIDAINLYLPVVALNTVAFGGFVIGFVLFGTAMAKTATLPRASGFLVAVGARSKWSGSLWLRPSHRRCGRLPSLAAWPLAPALPGLGINCGRTRRPDPPSPTPQIPFAHPSQLVARPSCVAGRRRRQATARILTSLHV